MNRFVRYDSADHAKINGILKENQAALQMFEDYQNERNEAENGQVQCRDKWIWYVTNGHLQCAECICYPEIGSPFTYGMVSQ